MERSTFSFQIPIIWELCKNYVYHQQYDGTYYWISVDHNILQHMVDSQSEFLMEVTNKTKADVKVALYTFCALH